MTVAKRVDALTRRNGPALTILAEDHGDETYTVDGQLLTRPEVDALASSGATVVMIREVVVEGTGQDGK